MLATACGDDGAQDLTAGDNHVLVSAAGDGGDDMGIVGKVQMVGDCLGIGAVVAFWPHGTKIVSEDPLTINVPGEGDVRIGDTVDGAGGSHSSGDATVDSSVPETAIPDSCPSESWVDYRPE